MGYMGVPYNGGEMTAHPQYLTVRNGRGREMLDAVAGRLTLLPTQSSGSRGAFVTQTVVADDECALRSGRAGCGCMPAMQAGSTPAFLPVQASSVCWGHVSGAHRIACCAQRLAAQACVSLRGATSADPLAKGRLAGVTVRARVTRARAARRARAKLGRGPDPAPRWVGELLARVLLAVGPKGLEFGRYSIDYHYARNWLYVQARVCPEPQRNLTCGLNARSSGTCYRVQSFRHAVSAGRNCAPRHAQQRFALPCSTCDRTRRVVACAARALLTACLAAQRAWGAERAAQHVPEFAKRLVARYDADGALTKRCALPICLRARNANWRDLRRPPSR